MKIEIIVHGGETYGDHSLVLDVGEAPSPDQVRKTLDHAFHAAFAIIGSRAHVTGPESDGTSQTP